ncbi:MAG: hypothetical protein GY815_04615 [Gammaproteobacteria bacterium]|nr:hypothetical protein [Gammaproteobacteria bacterium]
MARIYDHYLRLEPRRPLGDLTAGLRMEVHDPAWMLGRQWRMGEHQGEDASTPVQVDVTLRETVLKSLEGRDGINLESTPPEAAIEREHDDWWTPGRRVLYGRRAAPSLPPLDAADPALLLADLGIPYDTLEGRGYDGRAIFAQRESLGIPAAVFADVPQAPGDEFWSPSRFRYDARFTLEGGAPGLILSNHRGGELDWWSVEADAPLPPAPNDQLRDVTGVVGRITFPGAPHPRLWMLEDHAVDIAGVAPDRSHFATLLLVESLAGLGDNWFQMPLATRSGLVLTLESATVVDSFGDRWPLSAPQNWQLFGVDGLDADSVTLWPRAATPLEGPLLEEVVLGIDEDANLLVAVEQRLDGRDVPTDGSDGLSFEGNIAAPDSTIDANELASYSYSAANGLRNNWHPYVIDNTGPARRFVQARFADLSTPAGHLLKEPSARLLSNPKAGPGDSPHAIDPCAVRESGLRLLRRAKLARDATGRPLLWIERRHIPLIAPPSLNLDFDDAVLKTIVTPRV